MKLPEAAWLMYGISKRHVHLHAPLPVGVACSPLLLAVDVTRVMVSIVTIISNFIHKFLLCLITSLERTVHILNLYLASPDSITEDAYGLEHITLQIHSFKTGTCMFWL